MTWFFRALPGALEGESLLRGMWIRGKKYWEMVNRYFGDVWRGEVRRFLPERSRPPPVRRGKHDSPLTLVLVVVIVEMCLT